MVFSSHELLRILENPVDLVFAETRAGCRHTGKPLRHQVPRRMGVGIQYKGNAMLSGAPDHMSVGQAVPLPGGYFEDLMLPNTEKVIAAIRSTVAGRG